MRVKMLKNAPGSPDGVTVNEYTDGVVYEVPDDLGLAMVAHGEAMGMEDAPAASASPRVRVSRKPAADKKATAPPENK